MEGFKQVLAFPLYAAAVWLLWVLGRQSGVDALAAALGGTVLIALALWSWENARGNARALAWRAVTAISLAAALSILGSPLLRAGPLHPGALTEGWEAFSAQRLAALQREGEQLSERHAAQGTTVGRLREELAASQARNAKLAAAMAEKAWSVLLL